MPKQFDSLNRRVQPTFSSASLLHSDCVYFANGASLSGPWFRLPMIAFFLLFYFALFSPSNFFNIIQHLHARALVRTLARTLECEHICTLRYKQTKKLSFLVSNYQLFFCYTLASFHILAGDNNDDDRPSVFLSVQNSRVHSRCK